MRHGTWPRKIEAVAFIKNTSNRLGHRFYDHSMIEENSPYKESVYYSNECIYCKYTIHVAVNLLSGNVSGFRVDDIAGRIDYTDFKSNERMLYNICKRLVAMK